jgi:hypothetical protein
MSNYDPAADLASRTPEQVSEIEKRARAAGVSPEDFLRAERVGMSPRSYVGFRDVRTLGDYEALRERESLEAEARRQLTIDRAKAELQKAGAC